MDAQVDVAIVGAGAAGIAAARRLASTRLDVLLVEAMDRVGGRAWTRSFGSLPLDLGCGWLHSADRNPLAGLAEELGFTVDRTEPAWGRQFAELGFDRREQAEAEAAWEAFEQRLRDRPLSSDRGADALEPDGRWNAYLDARSGFINGTGLAAVSVADLLAYESTETGVNWRVAEGYGSVIAALAEDLPLKLGTPVTTIDRSSSPLLLTTPDGTIAARAVIVAVPTSILANGKLRIVPALEDKAEAAANLPLGLADKLFLDLKNAGELDADTHLIGNPRRVETGSYYLRPFGRPLIEAFFGGDTARALELEGPRGMADFAIEELASLFGSGFRRRVSPVAASGWLAEPWIGGSYSHACPGHAAARAILARPVENRLFFAGEACSPHDFSTVHGAFDTGEKAADAVIAALTD